MIVFSYTKIFKNFRFLNLNPQNIRVVTLLISNAGISSFIKLKDDLSVVSECDKTYLVDDDIDIIIRPYDRVKRYVATNF